MHSRDITIGGRDYGLAAELVALERNPLSVDRVSQHMIQRRVIGGWKPSHNTPHTGAKQLAKAAARAKGNRP